jgi:hypothetical protein
MDMACRAVRVRGRAGRSYRWLSRGLEAYAESAPWLGDSWFRPRSTWWWVPHLRIHVRGGNLWIWPIEYCGHPTVRRVLQCAWRIWKCCCRRWDARLRGASADLRVAKMTDVLVNQSDVQSNPGVHTDAQDSGAPVTPPR